MLLSGIGTSWHATLVGELLFAHAGRLGHRVRAFHSFELKSYWPDIDRTTGVVVVTHRGSKRYSREALEAAVGSTSSSNTLRQSFSRAGSAPGPAADIVRTSRG